MNKDKVRVLVILGELLVICIICVLFIIQGAPGSHRDEGTGSNVHAATIEGDGGDEPIPEENKALSPEEEAERLRLEKERLAEQERLAEEARLEAERKRIEEEKKSAE